jgi:hypothetical protein
MPLSSSRAAVRLVHRALASWLLVLCVSAVGCSRTDQQFTCFDWPGEAACPGDDVAVLYLGRAIPSCQGELVSIDTPPEHFQGQCCYLITTESSDGCGQIL